MTTADRILLAHGLEGSPQGGKATALTAAGFEVVAPDGRGKALAARIEDLRSAMDGDREMVLVGSSYGGLAAAFLANELRDQLRGVILCAPALIRSEPPVVHPEQLTIPSDLPCIIIHGRQDRVIPISASRELVERCPHVELLERDDDHGLRGSLDTLVHAAGRLHQRTHD